MTQDEPIQNARPQSLLDRVLLFGVGGMLSVLLNWGPFEWLRHSGLSEWRANALSLFFATLLMALWNYHLNFQTHDRFRECLPRYLTSLLLCALLSYGLTLSGVKYLGHTPLLRFLVFFVGQGLISVPKFLLYHYWVYPAPPAPAAISP